MMAKQELFETLWARMAERGDLPSLQQQVRGIARALQEEGATTGELASVVLSDFALTQKVIRLANSAMYAAFGSNITTVTQSIMALGADTVGHLAMGLQLVDSFAGLTGGQDNAKAELKRAVLAGEFARQASADRAPQDSETAGVCGLMHGLARLLLVFYFPEQWQAIRQRVEVEGENEDGACLAVLGVSLQEIAEEAAKQWGLPPAIAASMQVPQLNTQSPCESQHDWLGALACLGFEVAALALRAYSAEELERFALQFADWLALDPERVSRACRETVALKAKLDADPEQRERRQIEGKPLDAGKRLQQGLAKVRGLASGQAVSEVLPLVLETLMQSMWFSHCVAFLYQPGRKRFEAKLGFGPELSERLPQLGFEDGFIPDVFHLALSQRKTVFIADAQEGQFAQRLPGWYRGQFPETKSFLLLPVQLRGRCIALLYGDWGGRFCYSKPSTLEHEMLDLLAAEIAISFERQVQTLRYGAASNEDDALPKEVAGAFPAAKQG
jgi:HD-like signal output (HDOD) protein